MTNIRNYIDLIEQNLQEWPFSKKPSVDIDQRINGRREPKAALPAAPKTQKDYAASGEQVGVEFGKNGHSEPKHLSPTKPHDYDHPQVAMARKFKSAEAYAYDSNNNQYMPINSYDPPQVRQRAKSEAERLMRKWNMWKQQGYFQ
jgi:hypothetical protein